MRGGISYFPSARLSSSLCASALKGDFRYTLQEIVRKESGSHSRAAGAFGERTHPACRAARLARAIGREGAFVCGKPRAVGTAMAWRRPMFSARAPKTAREARALPDARRPHCPALSEVRGLFALPPRSRSTFLPAPFHSLAARPAPAATVPPGPLRQTLFYRPSCLPVIFFWSSICMDRRSFSTRCATTDLQRAYRGENSFLSENSRRLSARTAVPF